MCVCGGGCHTCLQTPDPGEGCEGTEGKAGRLGRGAGLQEETPRACPLGTEPLGWEELLLKVGERGQGRSPRGLSGNRVAEPV